MEREVDARNAILLVLTVVKPAERLGSRDSNNERAAERSAGSSYSLVAGGCMKTVSMIGSSSGLYSD